MHWDILDQKRTAILPLFAQMKNQSFYLAGGTALALYIGHRDSIDFDFFTLDSFDTEQLLQEILQVFSGHAVVVVQREHNTLGLIIDSSIKVSYMTYPYVLLEPLTQTEYFPLASISDIACMKLSAITSRSVLKDYVDLYYILQTRSIDQLFICMAQKMSALDANVVLKALVYFDDIVHEDILFKQGYEVDFDKIQKDLIHSVKGYQIKR
jgi:predicted nucleotidyltransferase component of viral defense system